MAVVHSLHAFSGAVMPIARLDQMLEAVKAGPRKRLVVACAHDAHTLEAVAGALDLGLVEATLVGEEAVILRVCAELGLDPARFTLVHAADPARAAAAAVALVSAGGGQILMKGLVSTETYMRAILSKEAGLMAPGAILSHVAVIEHRNYPKLLVCGDVAVLPNPDLKEKIAITNYVIGVAQALGIPRPRVALIAASEQVSPSLQATLDAAIIAKMAERGQLKAAFVDGPMALDVAVDGEAAAIKGVGGEVAGNADGLVFPNIDAGNVFYKTSTKLAGCELAAIVTGARVPCILSSRGDSALTKRYSITLAALTSC